MKAFLKVILWGLCAVLATGAAQAQAPIDMKPGLWETRILKMVQDGKDMLAEMEAQTRQAMAYLTPEQRKQFGDPMAGRMCVSPAMVKGDWLASQSAQKETCTPPKVTRNGNRVLFETTCKEREGTVVTKGEHISAGNLVTSKTEMVITEPGGAKSTTVQETQMKFLGSDCGDVKPMDQIVKEMQAGGAGKRKN